MFENIDNKYQPKPIEVFVEYVIDPPYNVSIEILCRVVNIWGLRLVYSNTLDSKAIVAMIIDKFKYLYKANPVIGKKYQMSGTNEFLEYGKVIQIEE